MSKHCIVTLLCTAMSVCGATAEVVAAAPAPAPALGPEVQPYVAVSAPLLALRHVSVIDGTGAAPRADQTLVLQNGRIAAIGPASSTAVPAGAELHDYPGYTVLPGLVGMHDHFYYSASNALQRGDGKSSEPGFQVNEIAFTAPRLYLAGGVTTLRTTGSIEPYTDIKVHDRIEAGLMPGPEIDLTAPYMEGGPTPFAQMRELKGAEDARRFIGVLHGMGCRFALDDFGSGMGSFSNLKLLAVDFLKIDGSFMRNLARDSVNQAMVTAMIKLARTLNFKVIAEQVEDAASLDAARAIGVDFLQGYALGRPAPLAIAA